MTHASLGWIPALAALCAAASAQTVPPLLPFERTLDLLVVDSSADGVWRLADRNQDGDYNDAGEVTTFYDDTTGSVTLTNPTCITWSGTGVAFIADSTVDQVVFLVDRNADGDANDAGEHGVFFDSATNASNVVMGSVQGMTADRVGSLFLAVANSGTTGNDAILRLQDRNGDGDAQDPGEAIEYCVIPGSSGSIGNSIPTEVVIGPDLHVYYTDVGATGNIKKGIYRLSDNNNDGDCNDPGEVAAFWLPTVAGNAFFWGAAVGRDGTWYVTDHGNERIYAAKDANNDNRITANEERTYHTTATATWWDISLRQDDKLIVCEDQTPDRLLALQDLNNDGDADDAGERVEIYSDLVSNVAIRPRGATFMRGPTLVVSPATARIGTTTQIQVTTPKANEPVTLLVALGPATISLPPFGVLGLEAASLTAVITANSNQVAALILPLPIPNDPTLVRSWPFQVVAGDLDRPFLSNVASLQVTR